MVMAAVSSAPSINVSYTASPWHVWPLTGACLAMVGYKSEAVAIVPTDAGGWSVLICLN
jgi:hypothetical protein